MTGQRRAARRGWATMAGLALAAAVISYLDGLFLVRMAGAQGRVAYLYPLLPDGLIVISAQSLYDAARAGGRRPGWATGGLVLGAGLTLGQNVGAGVVVGPLLACVDAVVPVVFFVAMEIFIGHIRRGRDATADMVSAPLWTDAETAAREALARTAAAGNPLSQNQLMTKFRLTRAEERKVRQAAGLASDRKKVAAMVKGGGEAAPGPSANGQGPHAG